jgi:hypothetical protein
MVNEANVQPFQFLQGWKGGAPDNGAGIGGVSDILGLTLNIFLGTALAISLIAIILSGIKYITAKGDPKAKAAAQQALTNSVIAFLLSIGAYTIKTIVFNVLGGDVGELGNATPNF